MFLIGSLKGLRFLLLFIFYGDKHAHQVSSYAVPSETLKETLPKFAVTIKFDNYICCGFYCDSRLQLHKPVRHFETEMRSKYKLT